MDRQKKMDVWGTRAHRVMAPSSTYGDVTAPALVGDHVISEATVWSVGQSSLALSACLVSVLRLIGCACDVCSAVAVWNLGKSLLLMGRQSFATLH